MRVRQRVVLPIVGKGVKRVKRGESSHAAGDHSYGVWRHKRDVVWGASHGQGVVWGASSPQDYIVRVQRVSDCPAVPVQVRVLLHLQGHDLLLLSVGQIIGSAPLGATAPMDVVSSLVLFIVKSSKG